VRERDEAMRHELEARGYTVDTSTRAMGMALDSIPVPRPDVELVRLDWDELLRVFEYPAGLLAGADHSQFHVLSAVLDGEPVSAAMAFDHDGDTGVFNVETLPRARRRGLGAAITAAQLYEARERGNRTATLQSTPMAERVYAAVGFRDLGRFIEYVPKSAA
jgi:GNAT superfamily N-acetyltransferase